MREKIIAYVIGSLEKKAPVPGENIEDKLQYEYLDNKHIDSFETMNLIMEIESEFNIRFTPENFQDERFRVVSGLVDIIEELSGK